MARWIPDAKSKVTFCPGVSNLAAPTSAELTAGTVLCTPGTYVNAGLKELGGFETTQEFVVSKDLATKVDSKIPGRQSLPDASLTFFDDDASSTIRTALAEGTVGFLVLMPYGQVTGKRCEVWPVTIGALNNSQLVAGGADPATFMVAAAVTSAPNKLAVVP